MRKAVKLFFISLFLLAAVSCEDSSALQTEGEFPVDVKVKTFTATSVEQLHTTPLLMRSSTNSILGRFTIQDDVGNDLYRVRVRPILYYNIAVWDQFRNKDNDELYFTGDHKFTFRVDSLGEENHFNRDFNQVVDLKLLNQIFDEEQYIRDNSSIYFNSRFSTLTDPTGEQLTVLGSTQRAVQSGVAGMRSTHDITVSSENLSNMFNRYDTGGDTEQFIFGGIALDYTQEQDGIILFDTLPTFEVNYILHDTIGVETAYIYPTEVMHYITYEEINTGYTNNYHAIRSSSRDGIRVNFPQAELVDFLQNTRFLGATFNFDRVAQPSDYSVGLDIQDIFSLDRISDSRYADGLPYDSIVTYPTSRVFLDEDNHSYSSAREQFVMNTIYANIIRNWTLGTGEVGSLILRAPNSANGGPAASLFPKMSANDSSYTISIYYTDLEN